MNAKEIESLVVALVATAAQSGREMKEVLLDVYVEALRDLPYPDVFSALKEFMRDGKMPTANELRTKVTGGVSAADEAQDTADRIIFAIGRYGSHQSSGAMTYIGPVGAEVVSRFGGWSTICEVETKDLGTLRAQLRDSARSVMTRAKAGRLNEPAQLPAPEKTRGLTPASDLVAGLLSGRK